MCVVLSREPPHCDTEYDVLKLCTCVLLSKNLLIVNEHDVLDVRVCVCVCVNCAHVWDLV